MILGAMTIVDEIFQQAPGIPPSEYYCPVGEGGLVPGVGIAAKATQVVKRVRICRSFVITTYPRAATIGIQSGSSFGTTLTASARRPQ